jgi:hypothetical protein
MDDFDETRDMFVLTLSVPREGLAVSVRDHTVTVEAAGGFHRELELAEDTDVHRLHAHLYDRTLELRAPRGPGASRAVPLHVLR